VEVKSYPRNQTNPTNFISAICDELGAVLMDAAHSGRAHEMIDELVAACEKALGIARLVRQGCGKGAY
jgi:hypothetical protein